MANQFAVKVEGLDSLKRSLKEMENRTPRELTKELKVTAKKVVDKATPQMPRLTGNLVAGTKASATSTEARATGDVPYHGFIEFGGKVGRDDSVVRQYVSAGRFLFPTAEKMSNELVRDVEKMIERLAF